MFVYYCVILIVMFSSESNEASLGEAVEATRPRDRTSKEAQNPTLGDMINPDRSTDALFGLIDAEGTTWNETIEMYIAKNGDCIIQGDILLTPEQCKQYVKDREETRSEIGLDRSEPHLHENINVDLSQFVIEEDTDSLTDDELGEIVKRSISDDRSVEVKLKK